MRGVYKWTGSDIDLDNPGFWRAGPCPDNSENVGSVGGFQGAYWWRANNALYFGVDAQYSLSDTDVSWSVKPNLTRRYN